VPLEAPDRERIENALLHLGRVLGAAMKLQTEEFGGVMPPALAELIGAAKRASTWLGATLWRENADE
jgi:hypothetical protein